MNEGGFEILGFWREEREFRWCENQKLDLWHLFIMPYGRQASSPKRRCLFLVKALKKI